jgi:hypothetical protein
MVVKELAHIGQDFKVGACALGDIKDCKPSVNNNTDYYSSRYISIRSRANQHFNRLAKTTIYLFHKQMRHIINILMAHLTFMG